MWLLLTLRSITPPQLFSTSEGGGMWRAENGSKCKRRITGLSQVPYMTNM